MAPSARSSPAFAEPAPRIDPGAIAFDVDGVVADTMRLFIEIAEEEYGIGGLRYEDITAYNVEECLDLPRPVVEGLLRRLILGGYRGDLRALPGAPEVVRRIAGQAGSVLFVTARPIAGPVESFLRRVLPDGAGGFELVATGSFEAKTEILRRRGITHFVEDRLETCFAMDRAGIRPVVFAQPWNRAPHPFLEVTSWQEIEDLIRW